jgi:nucleotide-binding universal stress UspA family protein
MFERVLLCYDASDAGRKALKRGAELAILVGAEVFVLSVLSEAASRAALMAGAVGTICVTDYELEHQRSLDESLNWLRARGVSARGRLVCGDTLEAIVSHAKQLSSDLVVVSHYPTPTGTRWWSNIGRPSLAEQLNCCVFIAVSE